MHLGKVEKLVTCMNCLQIIIVVKLVPSGRHEITCFFLVNTIKMMCFIHGYVGLPECRTVKSWQSRDCWLNVKEKGFHTVNGSEIRLTSWYGKYPIIIYRVLFRGDNQRCTVDGSEIRRSPVEVGSLSHNTGAGFLIHQEYQYWWVFFQKKKRKHQSTEPPESTTEIPTLSFYTTWKVDGATPMYWFIMAPY